METVKVKYLGQAAAEKLIEDTKDALNGKQPKGNYALMSDLGSLSDRAKIYFSEVEPDGFTANDMWVEISDFES